MANEKPIQFKSDGFNLAGVIRFPEDMKPGECRSAFIVLHGFGSNKDAGNVCQPVEMLSRLGYVTLRFDFRGCGESDGKKGHLICLEQVEDTRNAISALAEQTEVDPDRIGLLGSSFGAAVALYTAGVDERAAAVVSSGGWGNGAKKFRKQHASEEAWSRFTNMLQEGRSLLEKTGESLLVSRYDIVPIPPHLRGHLAKGSIIEFTVDTALSMYEFNAEEVVSRISPRPLLLLHSSSDSVTPTEQSLEIYKRAQQPTDLHLFAETDHFMFDEDNVRVRKLVSEWLERFFSSKPLTPAN